jgi:hypothetical protein
MRSRVIFGALINNTWDVLVHAEGTYQLGGAHYTDSESAIHPDDRRVSVRLQSEQLIQQDESYSVCKGQFHSASVTGYAVTLMQKVDSDYSISPANVLPATQTVAMAANHRPLTDKQMQNIVDHFLSNVRGELAHNADSVS